MTSCDGPSISATSAPSVDQQEEGLVPERLRLLVVLYTACNLEVLWKNPGFRPVLETHGDFSASLIEILLQRLED